MADMDVMLRGGGGGGGLASDMGAAVDAQTSSFVGSSILSSVGPACASAGDGSAAAAGADPAMMGAMAAAAEQLQPGITATSLSGVVGGSESKGDVILPQFSADSVRTVADMVALGPVPEDAARELAEDLTYRVKKLVQGAQKFMFHGKRKRLHCEDVDMALRLEGAEPVYGVSAREHVPFRFASGGGRELHFQEDKELDLAEITAAPLPKIPLGISLRAHWLAIEGVQPSIPENPPAKDKSELQKDSADPVNKYKHTDPRDNKLGTLHSKPTKLKNMETMNIKQLATHELSVEQQLYYKEITEACVGSDEGRRAEALQSLACDPGLHQMLPRLCTFIAEGVRVNVVQHNLAILIYLMRMVKSLLENQTLFLEKYLHELIPSCTTCIVSRQLCSRPDQDNHWALRDFASRLMANICKNFNTSTNNIQTRVTRMFSDAMQQEKSPLVSYYGALAGLQELGPDVVKTFIVPYVKHIGIRIDRALEGQQNIDKVAAQHIRTLLVKSVCPALKSMRPPPDNVEDYKAEFGASIGQFIHAGVVRSRQTSVAKPASASSTSLPTSALPAAGVAAVSTPTSSGTRLIAAQQPARANTPVAAAATAAGQQVLIQTSGTGGLSAAAGGAALRVVTSNTVAILPGAGATNTPKLSSSGQRIIVQQQHGGGGGTSRHRGKRTGGLSLTHLEIQRSSC